MCLHCELLNLKAASRFYKNLVITEKNTINRKILALAVPSIVANITTPLLGLVDTAIVGHMGSAVYIAAIAVGGVMFNMIYWLFGFLRAGTSGLSAQAYGAGDRRATTLVLRRSLAVAFIAGGAMVLLNRPLLALLTEFVGPDESTARLAGCYFSILIFGAPATLGLYALSGWFLGMQNSKMLMWTSLIINLVNIAASLLLVFVFHLKIEGVASGTLIAQWTGFFAGLLFLRRYEFVKVGWRDVLNLSELKRFFKVNVEVMLRTVCLIAVTVWFTRAGALQGAVILAVNTLLMQLFLLFSYMMDGFAYAGEALVGRYIGERNTSLLSRCVRLLMMWGVGLALLFTLIYFLGGESFLGLLSSDRDVILASKEYWLWAVSIPLAGFMAFVWDGVYIGATMTRELLLSMGVATLVFFLLYHLLYPSLGNHALWLAFVSYLATRGIAQALIYRFFGERKINS